MFNSYIPRIRENNIFLIDITVLIIIILLIIYMFLAHKYCEIYVKYFTCV